jgi:NADP-dependent 3-hydroxy acid dehydrogenase YdfG
MNDGTRKALLWGAAGLGAFFAVRAVVRRQRAYDLRDKTVLLTGGSRGLGLVLARRLVREGARLAICARDAAELDRARDELTRGGGQVLTRACDITDRA